MSITRQELTNVGIQYLRDAQLGKRFRIDRMVVGSGVATNLPGDLYPLTQLLALKMDVPIIKSEALDEHTILVSGAFSNLMNTTGVAWKWNELGLIVKDDANNDVLYSVSNTGEDTGDTIPGPDTPGVITKAPEIQIRIDRVQNIVINIVPTGFVDAVNRGLPVVGPGPYIEKVGDILHFRRFVGAGISIAGQQDTITWTIDKTSLVPTGCMLPFAGRNAPEGWYICDGRELSRIEEAELFSVIGTDHGDGDGTTTFNLPDLRGRCIFGVGPDLSLGERGGERMHTLIESELAAHGHPASSHQHNYYHTGAQNVASGTGMWSGGGNQSLLQSLQPSTIGYAVISPTGGNQPHNNMPPYLGGNYIIKA